MICVLFMCIFRAAFSEEVHDLFWHPSTRNCHARNISRSCPEAVRIPGTGKPVSVSIVILVGQSFCHLVRFWGRVAPRRRASSGWRSTTPLANSSGAAKSPCASGARLPSRKAVDGHLSPPPGNCKTPALTNSSPPLMQLVRAEMPQSTMRWSVFCCCW